MSPFLKTLGLSALVAVGLHLTGVSVAKADVEWRDCYAPYNHWRFGDGLWRYAPNDKNLFPWLDRDREHPFACGTYFYDAGRTPRQVLSRRQQEMMRTDPHLGACARRYQSYDITTDSFVGHDGRRRRCRL